HEEVGAEPDEEQRLAQRQAAQEALQVLGVGGLEVPVGRAAGAPAHVARHRLSVPEGAAQRLEEAGFGHVHMSSAGTLPIDPAPMVTTTSPSSAVRRIASGISAMSST